MPDHPETARRMVDLGSDRLTAAINPYGAELTHLRLPDGRELMTDADPAYWTGHAPLLFPVVGALAGGVLRLDGAEHPMPKHGFARRSLFEVVRAEAAEARFRLTDTDETRAAYPFAFALEVTYRLDGATLLVDVAVENRGDRPMPASFGFHPAFAWPLPFGRARADHRILFDADEPAPLREVLGNGLIAAETRASPLDGRTLRLADALFERDALVWDRLRSPGVTYGAADGPQLRVSFPDTPMLGVWTKPGAAFICIEPWHGVADPDGYAGDFRDKPGVWEVPPGDAKRMGLSVTLAE